MMMFGAVHVVLANYRDVICQRPVGLQRLFSIDRPPRGEQRGRKDFVTGIKSIVRRG